MQCTIVDNNVEAAPIYRYNSKAKQPTRPCDYHDLYMEQEPTMDGELTEATDTVIRSSYMWNIGYHI